MANPQNVAEFGTSARGETVQRVTLVKDDLTVSVLTHGAALQGVWLKGIAKSLALGSDNLADYQGVMRSHGTLVAPVVNRLSGGVAPIGGVLHQFESNQGGLHSLHSGAVGTHLRVWTLGPVTATSAQMSIDLPDGEGGFPGNRRVTVRFSLSEGNALRMTVTATTDALTLMNTANHGYWNLDGSENWTGHQLRIAADAYLPTTDSFAPTGEIRPVAGTAFDFRETRVITNDHPALDHNFCLSNQQTPLRDVLWLTGTRGLTMTIATTEAGVQIYDGRKATRPGHGTYEGLAIEPQNWPDAPNHPGFPSIELAPGQPFEQITEWRFTKR